MTSSAVHNAKETADRGPPPSGEYIAPAPRVSVQAFCETAETAAAVKSAGEDRRLGKAHLTVKMGGLAAAIKTYGAMPTPNVILLESEAGINILAGLDQLATVCDPGTRVVVIGSEHDDAPYRELVRRGVNDYVVGPVDTLDVVRSICGLFSASEAVTTGRIIAVVGAKGGVGASTVAHNVAWMIARDLALDSVVIDLDLAFGTAGLDYNQDPLQGIANAVFQSDRPDTMLMERLLAKCTDRLSLLAAPATLERVYDFGAEAFDAIFDTLRMTTPCIVLDVPHQWSGWSKRVLMSADEILIVAEPDLANLRNAKNLLNVLKASRPNDRAPLYCLNQVGMHKRPEIDVGGFAKAIESPPLAVIPFDSRMFGTAANNGQMIAEISAGHRTTQIFRQIAEQLTGRGEFKKPRGSFLSPIIRKLRGNRAAERRKAS
jgi:pilus assembly protein CpaE